MSTGLMFPKNGKILNLNRFAELARLGEVVFHTGDLANLWHITNKNTLYTTIKRYVEQGLIFRIHKGFYSIKPISEIDPLLLGIKTMHEFAYISTETILAEEGIIQQQLPSITLVSGKTKRFSVADRHYFSRKLPDEFLYQPNGINADTAGIRKATVSRAVADLLYFSPRAYFDASRLVPWKDVRALQKKLGYPIISNHPQS
jgi:predicted transcriptional regulator of viral defense system